MSAGVVLQTAVVSALAGVSGLTGVFDGPPARAAYPYAAIDASVESDWSHKSGTGREVLLAVTLWDDQPERLQTLADLVEAGVLAVAKTDGWQLVSLVLTRRKTVRDVAGPWACALNFRARMLAA
ncbi:MAG TPA: DUF3168 domain-containing protein [Sphingomicrobium sp.]|nr:DUF3168 domain-containing protein [Sphingomicrobium sp.]